MGEGKLEEAEKLINTIKDKEELANIIEVAYLYNDMGYSQKASQWLEIGKGLYDEDEAYLAVVADCLYGERKFDEAAVYYNKLIDKIPILPLIGLAWHDVISSNNSTTRLSMPATMPSYPTTNLPKHT